MRWTKALHADGCNELAELVDDFVVKAQTAAKAEPWTVDFTVAGGGMGARHYAYLTFELSPGEATLLHEAGLKIDRPERS